VIKLTRVGIQPC